MTMHIVTSNAQTTLQHEHTIAKLATRHLTMAVRGEHELVSYQDWPGNETNTCIHMPLVSISYTFAAVLGQSQTMPYMHLLKLIIFMPDSQQVM